MSKVNIDKKILVSALFVSLLTSILIGCLIFINTSRISFSDLPDFVTLDSYHNLYNMHIPLEMIIAIALFIFVILSPIFYMVFWHVKNDRRYLFYVVSPNLLVFIILIIDLFLNIGFWSNPFLVISLMCAIFALFLVYYFKIWKYRLIKRLTDRISKLQVSAKTAKNAGIAMMTLLFIVSGFIMVVWLIILFTFDFKSDLYIAPIINFAIVMIFYAFIWIFFTGMMFYEQYKFFNKGEFADFKPLPSVARNMRLNEKQKIKIICFLTVSIILLMVFLFVFNPGFKYSELRLKIWIMFVLSSSFSFIYLAAINFIFGLSKKRIEEFSDISSKNWNLFYSISIVFYGISFVLVYFFSNIWNFKEVLFIFFTGLMWIFLTCTVYIMKNTYQKI